MNTAIVSGATFTFLSSYRRAWGFVATHLAIPDLERGLSHRRARTSGGVERRGGRHAETGALAVTGDDGPAAAAAGRD